ncbi:MAG TPA: recombination protein RecO [Sulfuricurvum sp.]|nr:recombination protein RecO [Sulfuricurvum sp.]
MQGYIIRLQRVKDEDLILSILTKKRLETLYRFYGARHGTINLGYKIDFEIEHSLKSSIGRLYDVVHLGFPWLLEHDRLRVWQQFIALFYPHLKDSEEAGGFYFMLLEQCAEQWAKQNPKRIALEAYVQLLRYEGRLPDLEHCFFCEHHIDDTEIALIRGFQYAHTSCAHRQGVSATAVKELMQKNSTLFLNDSEVHQLWLTLTEGL